MNMRRIFTILTLAAVLLSLAGLAGCSDRIESAVMADEVADMDYYDAQAESWLQDGADNNSGWALKSHSQRGIDEHAGYDEDEYEEPSNSDGKDEIAGASAAEFERKVIRNSSLIVQAEEDQDAAELYALISTKNDELGGHEFSCVMNTNQNSYSKTVRASVKATLKVPPEKLDELLRYIESVAKVINIRSDSDDVTAKYYDLETRLETKRKSLESYYKLLENTEDLDGIVSVQRTIDTIIEEIEAKEGELRVLKSMVSMATLTLEIHHESELDEEEERREIDWGALSLDDMGYLISTGFKSVVNVILFVLQGLVIALAVMSPIWIPLTIVVVVLVRRSKARKAKRAEEIAQKEKEYKESREKEEKEESEKESEPNESDKSEK